MWGVISANINFQILLCHSPIMLFSFLRNSFMQFPILLFPFEFCYSFFWFYYAIINSFIHFPILLFAFELCYAVFQSCYSIRYSLLRQFRILLFPFKFCCSLFQFYYAIMNSFIQFPILLFAFEFSSSKSGSSFVWPTVRWGPVTSWFPEHRKTWQTWTSTLCGIDYEPA